jgi:hypothetical protein
LDKNSIKLTLWVVFLVQVLLCQGCNVFGFLATPGAFEEKVPPTCELKKYAEQKLFIWVEALSGSGADTGIADRLNQSIMVQVAKKVGVPKKNILTRDSLSLSSSASYQTPDQIGRQAGAGVVLYVRLEIFEVINMHSNTIYSGQMRARAFLIDSKDGKVICPVESNGIVSDVATELMTSGRDGIINRLIDTTAHCIVRRFYPCPKSEYQVNEERSTMNEMIRQDVY